MATSLNTHCLMEGMPAVVEVGLDHTPPPPLSNSPTGVHSHTHYRNTLSGKCSSLLLSIKVKLLSQQTVLKKRKRAFSTTDGSRTRSSISIQTLKDLSYLKQGESVLSFFL